MEQKICQPHKLVEQICLAVGLDQLSQMPLKRFTLDVDADVDADCGAVIRAELLPVGSKPLVKTFDLVAVERPVKATEEPCQE